MPGPTFISILSAGAPKTGVRRCAEAFRRASGHQFEIEFATGPVIRDRVLDGATNADLVIAPEAVMNGFADGGRIAPQSVSIIGSVSAGVAVRAGALEPDLSTLDTFRAALLAADGLVYNRASSGEYIATMIGGLEVADQVADKTVRVATGAAVMEHLAAERDGNVIGFGQITEIRLHENLGIRLVGPLPAAVGKVTTYAAGLATMSVGRAAPTALLAFMASADGRRIFAETGVA